MSYFKITAVKLDNLLGKCPLAKKGNPKEMVVLCICCGPIGPIHEKQIIRHLSHFHSYRLTL